MGFGSIEMTRTVVVKGRLVGPSTVELAEPISAQPGSEIEVVARVKTPGRGRKLSEIVSSFPPGTRTKEDIDRQINEDRDSW
jgi:hypothetical protein